MPSYRCAYCHKKLEEQLQPHCPHCGRVMLLPKNAYPKKQQKRRHNRQDEDDATIAVPHFRPGKNPAILGGIILVFILLGSLITTQLQTTQDITAQQDDPIARAWREVDALTEALHRFHEDTGRFPTEKEGLVALVQNPGVEGWDGHYVNIIHPDPWRTPYRYTITAETPEVRSAGPDQTFGTEADIYK